MKCMNCGAEIRNGVRFCEFCGTQITAEMQKEQEQMNRSGCPKCGSSNITFNREKLGEIRNERGTAIVRATVGFCGDCGYTWESMRSQSADPEPVHTAPEPVIPEPQPPEEKKNTIWWVLGWIFFFPAPVMVLIWRKKCTWDKKTKLTVTILFWLFLLLTNHSDSSSETALPPAGTAVEAAAELPAAPFIGI